MSICAYEVLRPLIQIKHYFTKLHFLELTNISYRIITNETVITLLTHCARKSGETITGK